MVSGDLDVLLCVAVWGDGYKTFPEYQAYLKEIARGRSPVSINLDLHERLRQRKAETREQRPPSESGRFDGNRNDW